MDRDPLSETIGAYRNTLLAMAECGARVCPALGDTLRQTLAELRDRLVPDDIAAATRVVDHELKMWGQRAAGYYNQKAVEIKELVLTLAHTVENVGDRDERYRLEFRGLTEKLQAIAGFEDLAEIRHLLKRRTAEMNACVDRMVQEGEAAISVLRARVEHYEQRLAQAEKLSHSDGLTGLMNRLALDIAMQDRVRAGTRFCIVMLDLNGFKNVNDVYGHLAGDRVLLEFASQLRSQFRAEDVVGRWGGDEFTILLDCEILEAKKRMDRVRRAAFREYEIEHEGKLVQTLLTASIGIAEWAPGYKLDVVFRAADTAMYQDKKLSRAGEPLARSSPAH